MAHVNGPMGFYEWNDTDDPYDYQQLAGNWEIAGFHDHTPGRGVPIPMGGIAPGAVGIVQLASNVPIIQTGSILMWPTNVIPMGYLVCNGDPYQIVAYEALYAVIGTLYDNSPPAGYFNVPNITLGGPPYGQLQWVIKT